MKDEQSLWHTYLDCWSEEGGIVSHTAMRYRSRVTTAKWRVGARKCSILSSANFHCYT